MGYATGFPSRVVRPPHQPRQPPHQPHRPHHQPRVPREGVEEDGGVKMTRLHVNSNIQLRYATTQITAYFKNKGSHAAEAEFKALIPDTAFISNFSMVVKGVEYVAEVEEKEKATDIFNSQVDSGQGAGLVEQDSRDSNLILVKANIEPAEKVVFHLTYDELLERSRGSYKQNFMVNPGQIVKDFLIKVNINESLPIVLLKAPQLMTSNEIDFSKTTEDSPIADIKRNIDNDPSKASVEFTISKEYQEAQGPEGVQGEFSVEYDVDRSNQTSEVQVIDGYFVHFFAPENLPVLPKHIIFVLDVSGSMSGEKLEQLQDAIFTILDELTEEDYFDIITFSYSASPSITLPATDENKKKGQKVILDLQADGGTNIDDALNTAINLGRRMKRKGILEGVETMIIFLTDGLASEGTTNQNSIISNVQNYNMRSKIPIYTIGFGEDADFDLMKKIADTTDGRAKRVYEGSDAALQLEGFYQEIASPLLTNINLKYVGDDVDQESISNKDKNLIFRGSEYVIAGKVPNNTNFTTIIEGEGKAGKYEQQFWCGTGINWPVKWPHIPSPRVVDEEPARSPAQSFIKKLYAFLTINQALKKDDEASKAKALQLALDNNFVTKLTSLVVVKENNVKENILPSPFNLLSLAAPPPAYHPAPYNYAPVVHHAPPYNAASAFQPAPLPASNSKSFNQVSGSYTIALPDGRISNHAYAAPQPHSAPNAIPAAPINYEDCKLSLFSKTYKRGMSITLNDTTLDLGDFSDLAVSAEVEGQCCWRVSGRTDQIQEVSLVLRPFTTCNSVTCLGNLLRNISSVERVSC